MPDSSSTWDSVYSSTSNLWTEGIDPVLSQYQALIPQGGVLDFGIGNGRNAFYLADRGYEVTGVDHSMVAIQQCQAKAKALNLNIELYSEDIRNFRITKQYSLIILSWIFPFLTIEEITRILPTLVNGLSPGGLLYIKTFSNLDPMNKLPKHTFPKNGEFHEVKTYFKHEQLLTLLKDLHLIHTADAIGLDLSHDKPHYHGYIEYLGKLPANN